MLRTIAAAAVAATLWAAPARAAEEINFGIISTESSTNLKKIWDPFLADMQKGTGLKINAFFASDYAGVIEGMRFKKVQIAWFGNKSAMEAVDRAERRGVRPDRRRKRRGRLLLAHHRAQGQPVPEARRRAQVRQVARFRHRRPELHLGLPGADDLRVLGQEHRPKAVLQDGPRRQPRGQRAGGRQQAGARRRQQQREPRAPEARPRPRRPRRSASSGPRR